MKSSEIVFIFLPAFYLIIWLMTSSNNFEKISILKIRQLVLFRGIKIYFCILPKSILTTQKKTCCHFFKMTIFSKFFGDFMRHIIR